MKGEGDDRSTASTHSRLDRPVAKRQTRRAASSRAACRRTTSRPTTKGGRAPRRVWRENARRRGAVVVPWHGLRTPPGSEQRVPEAQTFLRQTLLSTALAFRGRQLPLRATAKGLDHLAKRPADPRRRDAPQVGGAE